MSLFPYGNGDLGMAFLEIRRAPNPHFQPAPLDFIESMLVGYRVMPDLIPIANKDLVYEYVTMRSRDSGRSWSEIGRCPAFTRHYWCVGNPDCVSCGSSPLNTTARAFRTAGCSPPGTWERICDLESSTCSWEPTSSACNRVS